MKITGALVAGHSGKKDKVASIPGMRIQHFFHGSGSGSAGGKNPAPDPTLNRNEEKNISIF